jgi:hypothetical protein
LELQAPPPKISLQGVIDIRVVKELGHVSRITLPK